MTRTEAENLLARVETILGVVDAEAQESHKDAGGDLQGWDNQIVIAAGMPVEVNHNARAGVTWAAPTGWTPEGPAGAEDLTYDDGTLWSEAEEEFGTAVEAGTVVNGLAADVFWLKSNSQNLPHCGDAGGADAWQVTGSIGGTTFEFAADATDAQIESELRDCFPVFDIDFADAE